MAAPATPTRCFARVYVFCAGVAATKMATPTRHPSRFRGTRTGVDTGAAGAVVGAALFMGKPHPYARPITLTVRAFRFEAQPLPFLRDVGKPYRLVAVLLAPELVLFVEL